MSIDINRLSPWAQKQIEEKIKSQIRDKRIREIRDEVIAEKKKNKYGNVKTPRILKDGTEYIFDSKKEAERYDTLLLEERAGKIKDLRMQVVYELLPKRVGKQRTESALKYKADFVYIDLEGNEVVEDVKGKRTKEYIIKRKLMAHKYGIEIHEV